MAFIDFWEVKGYPKESRDRKGFQATRKVLCAWTDRYLLRELFIYHPGHLYPYIPGFGARAVSVASEPWAKQEQYNVAYPDLCTYDWALLTVRYATPKYGDAQAYPKHMDPVKHEIASAAISEQIEPSSEARKLDYTKFTWDDGTELAPDEAPVEILRRGVYLFTRHNLTASQVPDTSALEWTTNLEVITPILMPGRSYPAGTLLFEPPTTDYAADPEGNLTFDVTYRFSAKEEGWQKFWRADTKAYHALKVKEGGATYDKPEKVSWASIFP